MQRVVNWIRNTPVLGPAARRAYRRWVRPPAAVSSSERYWLERYESGGDSGDGSHRELAAFKAEIINDFVQKNAIRSVIEFGCGDGNQLARADYPSYLGFDISPRSVAACRQRFESDPTKRFGLMPDYRGETADLALSLDVIYHLIEDQVFEDHMRLLFDAAQRFVIIYSSNTDVNDPIQPGHVRHRQFTRWVEQSRLDWTVHAHIPNRHPFRGDRRSGSFADFYIYERREIVAGAGREGEAA